MKSPAVIKYGLRQRDLRKIRVDSQGRYCARDVLQCFYTAYACTGIFRYARENPLEVGGLFNLPRGYFPPSAKLKSCANAYILEPGQVSSWLVAIEPIAAKVEIAIADHANLVAEREQKAFDRNQELIDQSKARAQQQDQRFKDRAAAETARLLEQEQRLEQQAFAAFEKTLVEKKR